MTTFGFIAKTLGLGATKFVSTQETIAKAFPRLVHSYLALRTLPEQLSSAPGIKRGVEAEFPFDMLQKNKSSSGKHANSWVAFQKFLYLVYNSKKGTAYLNNKTADKLPFIITCKTSVTELVRMWNNQITPPFETEKEARLQLVTQLVYFQWAMLKYLYSRQQGYVKQNFAGKQQDFWKRIYPAAVTGRDTFTYFSDETQWRGFLVDSNYIAEDEGDDRDDSWIWNPNLSDDFIRIDRTYWERAIIKNNPTEANPSLNEKINSLYYGQDNSGNDAYHDPTLTFVARTFHFKLPGAEAETMVISEEIVAGVDEPNVGSGLVSEDARRYVSIEEAQTEAGTLVSSESAPQTTSPPAQEKFPKSALNACLTALANTIGIPAPYWKRWQMELYLLAKFLSNLDVQYHPISDSLVGIDTFNELSEMEGGLRPGCVLVKNTTQNWNEPTLAAKCFRDGSTQWGRDKNVYAAVGPKWVKIKLSVSERAAFKPEMLPSSSSTEFSEKTFAEILENLRNARPGNPLRTGASRDDYMHLTD